VDGKVWISGYVSMDRMMKIDGAARVGHTSMVTNRSNARLYPGGCPMNIAAALNRLGIRAVPIIRVGADYETLGIPGFMAEYQIPNDGMSVVEEELTSRCYLIQDEENNHITLFYDGAMSGKYRRELPAGWFEDASLGILTVGSLEDNEAFLEACKSHGVPLVFGMKGDARAFPKEFLQKVLSEAELIFVNEEEARMMEEQLGWSIDEIVQRQKARAVITTMGGAGSVCRYLRDGKAERITVPSIPAVGEVDTAGAGDAYLSGFVYGYLRGFDWETCCLAGTVEAWMVLQKEGCCTNLPGEKRLAEEMERHGDRIHRKGRTG